MHPHARTEGLIVQELAEETLVYDQATGKAHCLNRSAALTWKHCDGRTTVAELAGILHRELGLPADTAPVLLALEQLSRRRLIDPLPAEPAAVRQGRRRMLRKMAVGLAALPIVLTVTAPGAARAASTAGNPCPFPQVLCSGVCRDTSSDKQNCGSCGALCQPAHAVSAVCAQGYCTILTCETGFTNCFPTAGCVNTNNDNNNCGACGNVCTGTTPFCSLGTCVSSSQGSR